MSRILYLPASKHSPSRAQAQTPKSAVRRYRRGADERQLIHDLKNCMSALLLGLATLECDGDQWKISARSRELFEDVVLDMNRIVDELIHSTRQ